MSDGVLDFVRDGVSNRWGATVSMYDDLCELSWPSEFVVQYTDGARERLLRGDGVSLLSSADDPEGSGALMAELPKKHDRNDRCCRHVRFTKLQTITTIDGQVLWDRRNSKAAPEFNERHFR